MTTQHIAVYEQDEYLTETAEDVRHEEFRTSAKSQTMKAVVYHRYGAPDVVAIADVAKPVPSDNEVLVRIHATTVSTGDWRARTLKLPGGFSFLGRPVFGFFG